MSNGGHRSQVSAGLRPTTDECKVASISNGQHVCGHARGSRCADGGDGGGIQNCQGLAMCDSKEHDHTLVGLVGRAAISGHDANDLESESLRLTEVTRHQAEDTGAIWKAQKAPERLNRLATRVAGERRAHQVDARPHRKQLVNQSLVNEENLHANKLRFGCGSEMRLR